MERAELERLDRDTLISRAEELGVVRANVLTRPELIDELLVRSAPKKDDPQLARARGLFGRARDLLARVVEKGLHLPDAAERIRSANLGGPRNGGAGSRRAPAALPTVTLAEIYATQGHKSKAVDTLKRVLESEPDHAAARALLAQIEEAEIPSPAMPPEADDEGAAAADGEGAPPAGSGSDGGGGGQRPPAEPFGMLDDAPLPPKYDVDECVAIPVDPRTMFVYWEVRDDTFAHLKKTRAGGHISLRVLVIEPTWDGPKTTVRDHDVWAQIGEFFVRDLPLGSVVRTGLGWRDGEAFVPVAHSPALEVPPGVPSPVVAELLVKWTSRGAQEVDDDDERAGRIVRALGNADFYRRRRGGAPRVGGSPWEGAGWFEEDYELPLGSSELRARQRFGAFGAPGPAGPLGSSDRNLSGAGRRSTREER